MPVTPAGSAGLPALAGYFRTSARSAGPPPLRGEFWPGAPENPAEGGRRQWR